MIQSSRSIGLYSMSSTVTADSLVAPLNWTGLPAKQTGFGSTAMEVPVLIRHHPMTGISSQGVSFLVQEVKQSAVATSAAAMRMWIEDNAKFFRRLFDHLAEIETATADWKRRETEPPSPSALDNARALLARFQASNIRPQRVIPTAEGGIGILFHAGVRYADYECANSGSITSLFSDGNGIVRAQVVHASFEGEEASLAQLAKFLNPSEFQRTA